MEHAVETLTPIVGTRPAYRGLGVAPPPIYRSRRPPVRSPSMPRKPPACKLSPAEREAVLEELPSERFVDCSPAQVWATVLDEGRYLASEGTMYRLLTAAGECRERRNQLVNPAKLSWNCWPSAPTSSGAWT
jgi:putative transposase